jgi:hypothetical protein
MAEQAFFQAALRGLFLGFARSAGSMHSQAQDAYAGVLDAMAQDGDVRSRVTLADAATEPLGVEDLQEYSVDLLLLNAMEKAAAANGEEYLDSEEWLAVEADLEERGTELMNLLLFIDYCRDTEEVPDIEEYFDEDLLEDSEEMQEEMEIYEDIIANKHLVEGKASEVLTQAREIAEENPHLAELATAMLLFFADPADPKYAFEAVAKSPSDTAALETALLGCLYGYYLGEAGLPDGIRPQ